MKKNVNLLVSVMVSMISVAVMSGCSGTSTTDNLKQIATDYIYEDATVVVPDRTDENTFSNSGECDGIENEERGREDSSEENSVEESSTEENSAEESSVEESSAEDNSAEDNSAEDNSAEENSVEEAGYSDEELFNSSTNDAGIHDVVPSNSPDSSGNSSSIASGEADGDTASDTAINTASGATSSDYAGNSVASNESDSDWFLVNWNNGTSTTFTYGTPTADPEPVPAEPDTVNGTYTYVCYVVYDMLDEINDRRRANGCPDATWAYEWEEKALVRVRKLAPNPGDTMWQNFGHDSNSYWGGCPADEMVGSKECIAAGFWLNDASRIDQQYADSPLHNASLHNDGTFPLTKVCSVNCDVYIDGVYYCSFNATITD